MSSPSAAVRGGAAAAARAAWRTAPVSSPERRLLAAALLEMLPALAPYGRAVQAQPIKPVLKAPGNKRLKLQCDILRSNFAVKFNLRRYITARKLARPWSSHGGCWYGHVKHYPPA